MADLMPSVHHKRPYRSLREDSNSVRDASPRSRLRNSPTPNLFVSPSPPRSSIQSQGRRTIHPHNPIPVRQNSETMPGRFQSQQRPRLEHQASQTVIDLTNDIDDSFTTRNLERRPPRLGRSDGQNIIDLTTVEDVMNVPEDDVQITHARSVPPDEVRPLHELNLPRALPEIFFDGNMAGDVQMIINALAPLQGAANDVWQHIFHAPPAMPQNLNYNQNAFAPPIPNYIHPTEVRHGFTRSCKDQEEEENTFLCPGCDEELEHRKDGHERTPISKSGRISKKDREEHPWWVVKDCGHVYCNTCFQNRSSKGSVASVFRPISGKRGLQCAVDDCISDVKPKDKWVGVFP